MNLETRSARPEGAGSRRWWDLLPLLALVALGIATLGGCGPDEESHGARDAAPFPGSAETLRELGEQALEAVAARDTVTLERLRLTESEHNRTLWPELPASDPALNVPLDFVWENIEVRNAAALVRLWPLLKGVDVQVRAVGCLGETRTFETFRVHTDCWIEFSSARYGGARIQLFEDAVERGGGFKVFRYYDNRPRPSATSRALSVTDS